MAPLEPAWRAIPPTGTKRLVQDTNSGAIYRDIVYFFRTFASVLVIGRFYKLALSYMMSIAQQIFNLSELA